MDLAYGFVRNVRGDGGDRARPTGPGRFRKVEVFPGRENTTTRGARLGVVRV